MTFVVIDEDGRFGITINNADRDAVNGAVGPEGFDLVRMYDEPAMYAYVNDSGLLLPARYRRNPVGACVIALCGARQGIYAGPIVITGWDEDGQPTEMCDLNVDQVEHLSRLHRTVLKGLRGEIRRVGPAPAEELRAYARHVEYGTPPGVEIVAMSEWGVPR